MCRRSFCALLSAFSLDPGEPSYTDGKTNGRLWKLLSPEKQWLFLTAYSEGVQSLRKVLTALPDSAARQVLLEQSRHALPQEMLISELADAVTALYADPTCAPVPIQTMVEIIALKTRGESAINIQRVLDGARAVYTER